MVSRAANIIQHLKPVTTSSPYTVSIHPLSGALGAEIQGVDLANIDDDTFAFVKEAFLKYQLLVFKDQNISKEKQVEFTARFGPVLPHPFQKTKGVKTPEVLILENKPGRNNFRNDVWHSDISMNEKPPLGAVLYAKVIPPGGKSNTMWCNMYKAYENLSPGVKIAFEGKTAIHNGERLKRRLNKAKQNYLKTDKPRQDIHHPVFRTHPETGRKALFVNSGFTERFTGWTVGESQPVIDYFMEQATHPRNCYRHNWEVNDILIWDNRCTMHVVVDDYDNDEHRLMHRCTAEGDRPT